MTLKISQLKCKNLCTIYMQGSDWSKKKKLFDQINRNLAQPLIHDTKLQNVFENDLGIIQECICNICSVAIMIAGYTEGKNMII